MPAALVVALVSVPLSLGIALASGAPPLCGLTSEIIAGLIFPLLGGAYVTISGPAAGLAPVLFAAINTLGRGNMEQGYHYVGCVIFMVGIVQLILTWMKAANFCKVFPTAAIHGMLASIGFLLMAKQIPLFLGVKFKAHDFFPILGEIPSAAAHASPMVFGIGIACLASLFILASKKVGHGFLRMLPPQIIVVAIGVALGVALHVDKQVLVKVPENVLQHGIVVPDFKGLMSTLSLLPQAVMFVLLLTFIDGTESLATIQAVDRIDPFRRKSSADKTLFAMGISNICSSLIGGLTIIPGIIKSTTNIMSGGRTAWVNFYNAIFILTFLLVAGNVIRMIPLAALAAVLVHIGWKLAGPQKWLSMYKLGIAELSVFSLTILVTLQTDLMMGIGAGMLMELLILAGYFIVANRKSGNPSISAETLSVLFKSPLSGVDTIDGVMHVQFTGAIHCFNSLGVRAVLDNIPDDVTKLVLHFGPTVLLVDHSMASYLNTLRSDLTESGKAVEMDGFESLRPCTKDEAALRYRARRAKSVVAAAH